MAFLHYADYLAKRAAPQQRLSFAKAPTTAIPGIPWIFQSGWQALGAPGAAGVAPSGAASICDNTTLGSMKQQDASAGALNAIVRRMGLGYAGGQNVAVGCYAFLCDRLAHIGGLDGTITTPQTVSTPALTRFTDGIGVWAAMELHASMGDGSLGGTATIDYTNTANAAGRVTPAVVTPSGASSRVTRFIPFSLENNDGGKGVKAVNTVTITGPFATAGNVGITLYKPLMMLPLTVSFPAGKYEPISDSGFHVPQIPANACLWWVFALSSNSGAFTLFGEIDLVEA